MHGTCKYVPISLNWIYINYPYLPETEDYLYSQYSSEIEKGLILTFFNKTLPSIIRSIFEEEFRLHKRLQFI